MCGNQSAATPAHSILRPAAADRFECPPGSIELLELHQRIAEFGMLPDAPWRRIAGAYPFQHRSNDPDLGRLSRCPERGSNIFKRQLFVVRIGSLRHVATL